MSNFMSHYLVPAAIVAVAIVLVLGLVPLAVRLPGPERAAVWLQAVVFSLYGFAVAGLACWLAWP